MPTAHLGWNDAAPQKTGNLKGFDILQICQKLLQYTCMQTSWQKQHYRICSMKKRNNTMCLLVHGLFVSVKGTFKHVWCTGDPCFILKLITVSQRPNRQVKSSALRLETVKMETYSIHSQVIKGEKTAATMKKVKHASR